MSLEESTPGLNRGSGDKTAKRVPVDENTYNNVVGGVGYICLFLLISTDNFNNCWGKVSLIFGALSVLTFVGWFILRMLKPSVQHEKWIFWPLWSFCFFSGVFGWIFAIISRLMT